MIPFNYSKRSNELDNPPPRVPRRFPPNIPLEFDAALDPEAQPAASPPVAPPAIDPKLVASVRPNGNNNTVATVTGPQPAMRPMEPLVEPPPAPPPPVDPVIENFDKTPTVSYDSKGRPVSAHGGPSEVANKRALKEATEGYIPQKATGWKRYLVPIMQSVLASTAGRMGGHPAAMAGGGIVGALRSIFDPTSQNRDWKTRRTAEIDEEINSQFEQQKAQAQIDEIRGRTEAKPEAAAAKALAEYNKLDKYDPTDPADAGLKNYFDSHGLVGLPARSKQWRPDARLVGGRLVITNLNTATAKQATEGGKGVVDESKVPNHSVTLGGVVYDNLTAEEAAILGGRAAEGEANRKSREEEGAANRKSREKIAANRESGMNARSAANRAAKGGGGVLNPTLRGAVIAISKFRSLTTRMESAKSLGDFQTAAALEAERNGHEQTMRAIYGDILQNDDKGKPTVLNSSYTNPVSDSSTVDLTGQSRSLSAWRKKYPKANKEQEERWRANVEASGGTVVE